MVMEFVVILISVHMIPRMIPMPMEFVVIVLQRFFHLSSEKAVQIMLNVHTRGSGVCGVYTAEIAETKIRQVLNFATENEHPLQCTMEPD